MAVLFLTLGAFFACTTLAIFTCASHKKNKDADEKKKAPLPREKDPEKANSTPKARDWDSITKTWSGPDTITPVPSAVVSPMVRQARLSPTVREPSLSYLDRQNYDSPFPQSPQLFPVSNGQIAHPTRLDRPPNAASSESQIALSSSSSSSNWSTTANTGTQAAAPAAKLPPATSAIVVQRPCYSNVSSTARPFSSYTMPSQPGIHRSSLASYEPYSHNYISSSPPEKSVSPPLTAHENPDRGPITRLVPISSTSNRPSALRSMVPNLASIRPSPQSATQRSQSQPCRHCAQSSTNSGTQNVGLKPTHDARDEARNKRAPPTPIVVIHGSNPQGYHRRYSNYSRHYYPVDEAHRTPYEENEEGIDDECPEDCYDYNDEYEEGDTKSTDEEAEETDEEDQPARLDLRGLFVREALAAAQTFLSRQDERYKESKFSDNRRFVYIVTGWGKLSPGQKPKLKPAVENLLNSTSFKLKYEYHWTNDGEMEVDLIGRKTEADLRKRSQERMRQRQKNSK